jgi:hypothetical protein
MSATSRWNPQEKSVLLIFSTLGIGGGALGAGYNALEPGEQIDLKPETLSRFTTTQPVTVTVKLHNGIPQEMPVANHVSLNTRAPAQ